MSIEYTIIVSVISVMGTMLGLYLGMSGLRQSQRAEDRNESSQIARIISKVDNMGALVEHMEARVEIQLNHIGSGVNSVQGDMSAIRNDIREQRDRIVRVEESVKKAHWRLDEMRGKKNQESEEGT